MSQDNNAKRWAVIRAVSSYLPSRSLTNAELAKEVGWTPEQILEKTGIEERRIAAEGECVSDMVTAAVSRLLRDNGLDGRAPQFLILCTQTPDFMLQLCIVIRFWRGMLQGIDLP